MMNANRKTLTCLTVALIVTIALLPGFAGRAQDDTASGNPDSVDKITSDQERLAEQYRLLEEKLFSLHEFERDQNPDRSNLLQRAYTRSKQDLTLKKLQVIAELLGNERLRDAHGHQEEVLTQLESLLALLESENRSKRVQDEIKRHQEYLKEVNRILRIQQGLRGQTEGSGDSKRLANSQGKTADRT